MARGFETLQNIERAIGELRAKEEALAREMEQANASRADLMRERAKQLRALAEVRARSAVADGVIDEADRLENDVEMILSSRQKSISMLQARHREAVEHRREVLAESETQHGLIVKLEAELDAIAEQARQTLAADATYSAAKSRRDELFNQRAKAAEKAEQAKADRLRKGKPYEDDPLFMYLWKRNYRGRDINANTIVRWLDEWVAKLVGYNSARANYAMLLEIPVRLDEHVARLTTEYTQAANQTEAMESKRITELAGEDLAGRLGKERQAQKDIDARLSATETDLNAAANLLNRYAEGLDDSFKLAVETLAAFLERQRYDRLVFEARTTAEPTDDELVVRIGELSRQAAETEQRVLSRKTELDKLARRREELIKVAAEFRRKSYHQPGSIFEPDMDLDDLLEGVIRGILTGAEYWARTRSRQRWSDRAGDPYRRSSGFPPFDFDFGSSGGGSRGRSSGGGSDFETRGGF